MKVKWFVLLVVGGMALQAQTPYRYTYALFPVQQTHTDQAYATAPELNSPYTGESATHQQELKMHIFQPENDTLARRPMLICAHGGAFVTGNKEHDDMLAFCEYFARRGYVAATMQYRLGMNAASVASGERSVYRALQDSRAAVRYIKENAEILGVDTSRVYFLGSSAGAFTGLHNVFMNTAAERPVSAGEISNFPPTLDDGPDLGGYDAIASQYVHDGQPDAVIALWGALKNTSLIEEGDAEIPVFLVHGTADNIVPFGIGSPFNSPTLPATYGSDPISRRFAELDYPHETYFVPGEGHEFYGVSNGMWDPEPNAYWDTVTVRSAEFLYGLHKPTADFSFTVNGSEIRLTNLSSQDVESWHWDLGDGETSTEPAPAHTYGQDGTYRIRLYAANEIASWDTTSQEVTVNSSAVDTDGNAPQKFALMPASPNPFNPETRIEFHLTRASRIDAAVYDLTGRRVRRLLNGHRPAGTHFVSWNGLDDSGHSTSTGTYLVVLKTDEGTRTRKIVLLR